MKKILLVTAFSIGSLTAFAQTDTQVEVGANETEVSVAAETQDGFNAIEISELPAAVSEALSADYPDAEIQAAYVNDEEQYKLEVAKADGSTEELYADAEGNWIDM